MSTMDTTPQESSPADAVTAALDATIDRLTAAGRALSAAHADGEPHARGAAQAAHDEAEEAFRLASQAYRHATSTETSPVTDP